jgi:hypothetical protein
MSEQQATIEAMLVHEIGLCFNPNYVDGIREERKNRKRAVSRGLDEHNDVSLARSLSFPIYLSSRVVMKHPIAGYHGDNA